MKFPRAPVLLLLLPVLFGSPALFCGTEAAVPVTPDASPEARALLQVLHDISGKYMLKDVWRLSARGDVLTMQRSSSSPMGQQSLTLVFDRR
jgi:hypothetical protein